MSIGEFGGQFSGTGTTATGTVVTFTAGASQFVLYAVSGTANVGINSGSAAFMTVPQGESFSQPAKKMDTILVQGVGGTCRYQGTWLRVL